MNAPRSGCPITLTLGALGDRWRRSVIRDLRFGDRRHSREVLTRFEEGRASTMLADRLTRLERAGSVSRRDDPSHKQKVLYSLPEASIALVPLLTCDVLIVDELGYLPTSPAFGPALYELIASRYERRPTLLTSNKSLTEWGPSSRTPPWPRPWSTASCTTATSSI